MTLLTLKEISDGLDKEFLHLEPMLTGYRLITKSTPSDLIGGVESKLSVTLPSDFRDIISQFDFGNLTIGPIAFCASGDYPDELVELNTDVCWWGSGSRPSNLLMIANSDPFVILLDVQSGFVLALDSDTGWESSTKVAEDFRKFLMGLGTVMLKRNETPDRSLLAKAVFADVGSENLEFWSALAH